MIDDGDLAATFHRRDIGKNLRTILRAARDGDILDVLDRLDSVLRDLRNQVDPGIWQVFQPDEKVWDAGMHLSIVEV